MVVVHRGASATSKSVCVALFEVVTSTLKVCLRSDMADRVRKTQSYSGKQSRQFKTHEHSLIEVWDLNHSESMPKTLRHIAAMMRGYFLGCTYEEPVPIGQQNCKQQLMQNLALKFCAMSPSCHSAWLPRSDIALCWYCGCRSPQTAIVNNFQVLNLSGT